jgi:GT2 family glycosyltransferase/2-polyprenyl-3-methyl-5-hydroxy-6-metoxy-1,4-benzoquinol methylase
LKRLAGECGIPDGALIYATDEPRDWILAADLVVAFDSGMSIEAVLAGTPTLNLQTDFAALVGPAFSPELGVVEVRPCEFAEAARTMLTDSALRAQLATAMAVARPFLNCGADGLASSRLAERLGSSIAKSERSYVWQTHLNVSDADASQYHNHAQSHLFEFFSHPPRRVLDIGCGTGATGGALRAAYPQAEVWGIEVNRAAAEIAGTKIDHALTGKFEDIDLDAAGIAPGSFDTVIVADVLEHLYDPWAVLVRLKPYLTPDAQVIASIPNIRNLVVMEELAKGNWRYEAWGLLDITHIRFFTHKEVRRFFHETGYRVTQTRFNLDSRLADFYQRNQGQKLCNVEFERMTLKNVTAEELMELCALQIVVRAEPGPLADDAFKAQVGPPTSDYALWLAMRQMKQLETDLWEKRIAGWANPVRVHLVVVAAPANIDRVSATLLSATRQYYHNVRMSVVADAAAPEGWSDSERLAWHVASGDIVTAINCAVTQCPTDWIGIVDAGDQLAPHSLLVMLEAAQSNPDWKMIYSDEDTVSESGEHSRPHFKPDLNPDLLRSYPYVGGLLLVKHDLFAALGGFDAAMLGIEDYDLVLRAMELAGGGGIGHVADVMLHRLENGGHSARPAAELVAAGRLAVVAHLERLGIAAEVGGGFLPLSQRIVYWHDGASLVSILVLARDRLDHLQRCIEALFTHTHYGNFELLILDANSADTALSDYVQSLESLGDVRIKSFRLDQSASRSAYLNVLGTQAAGEYLLFLDADVVVAQDDWLEAMLTHARRAEIGVVGPRLIGVDGKVRQAGVIVGLGGTGRSMTTGTALDDPGYFGRAMLEQTVSAVGAGMLMTRRSVFIEAGGFGADLAPELAEYDYCLRLGEWNLRTLWTPYVGVIGEGAAANSDWGVAPADDLEFSSRWLKRLSRDPNYNVNFRLFPGEAFVVDARTTLNWDPLPWKPLPRILACPADNMGCGQYRVIGPMRALTTAGKVQGWSDFNAFDPVETERLDLHSLVLQRQITDEQMAIVKRYHRLSKVFRVFELDDLLLNLPGRSIHRGDMPEDIATRLSTVIPLCDRLIVSTEPLVDAYLGLNADICVVPNFIEAARWNDLVPKRRQGPRPRVGWVGGAGHTGDLEMVADVVRELAKEVDWVFMGMCPDALRPFIREFQPGVHFDLYPKQVAALNLDLAIAPLQINAFNEAKSNLRLLEYGVLGYPVVCSDIYPYQGDFPVTRVRNRSTDWINAIREQIADLNECARQGDALREYVRRDWLLENNLETWMRAWLP